MNRAEKVRVYRRTWKRRHPAKVLAHKALARAVKSGRVVRPEMCEVCARRPATLGHHDSYEPADRLCVVHMCVKCHERLHGARRARA